MPHSLPLGLLLVMVMSSDCLSLTDDAVSLDEHDWGDKQGGAILSIL